MYHLPRVSMIQIADRLNKRNAGYWAGRVQRGKEVRKGEGSDFVYSRRKGRLRSLLDVRRNSIKTALHRKRKLIVKDAGHGESYYKDTEGYEAALDSFIGGIMK